MTSIAEIHEILDRTARRDEEYRAEAARRDTEYKAAEERRKADEERRKADEERRKAERDAEYARRDAERKAEFEAEMKLFRKEMQAEHKKTDAAIRKMSNEFNSQWGRFVEALCANQVVPLLNSRGIEVHHIGPRVKRSLPAGGQYEIDILAVNGDTIVAFEVKTTLRPPDVEWFVEKLGYVREMFREYRDYRVLGGVAYLREESFAAQGAQKQGLFTILATGNGAVITNPKEFEPKAW